MAGKTDREQLRGILSEFSVRDVTSALEDMQADLMP